MASNVWSLFYFSWYRRLASVTIWASLLYFSLQSGECAINDEFKNTKLIDGILNPVNYRDENLLTSKFDQLETIFESALRPASEGLNFLHSFIDEINSQYGLSLTLQDACKLIKEKLYPNEFKSWFLAASAWQQIFGPHSRLAVGNGRSLLKQKFVPLPGQIPNF